jgi:hypothetical protein
VSAGARGESIGDTHAKKAASREDAKGAELKKDDTHAKKSRLTRRREDAKGDRKALAKRQN